MYKWGYEVGEVFRVRNLRFCIYPMDHYPPHVHVLAPDAEAKFRLDDFTCLACYGFPESGVREIVEFLRLNHHLLWKAWHENQRKK